MLTVLTVLTQIRIVARVVRYRSLRRGDVCALVSGPLDRETVTMLNRR